MRHVRARQVSIGRYPSGAPREVFQFVTGAEGRPVRDGIWTSWHEGGELERLVHYVRGVPSGIETTWDPDGRVSSRTEHRGAQ